MPDRPCGQALLHELVPVLASRRGHLDGVPSRGELQPGAPARTTTPGNPSSATTRLLPPPSTSTGSGSASAAPDRFDQLLLRCRLDESRRRAAQVQGRVVGQPDLLGRVLTPASMPHAASANSGGSGRVAAAGRYPHWPCHCISGEPRHLAQVRPLPGTLGQLVLGRRPGQRPTGRAGTARRRRPSPGRSASCEYRDRARSAAAMPYACSSAGRASSIRTRCASIAGCSGATSRPVTPSTTASAWAPTAETTTGVPQAMA